MLLCYFWQTPGRQSHYVNVDVNAPDKKTTKTSAGVEQQGRTYMPRERRVSMTAGVLRGSDSRSSAQLSNGTHLKQLVLTEIPYIKVLQQSSTSAATIAATLCHC